MTTIDKTITPSTIEVNQDVLSTIQGGSPTHPLVQQNAQLAFYGFVDGDLTSDERASRAERLGKASTAP